MTTAKAYKNLHIRLNELCEYVTGGLISPAEYANAGTKAFLTYRADIRLAYQEEKERINNELELLQ